MPTFLRVVYLALALAAGLGALAMLGVSILDSASPWDRFGFACGFLGVGALGVFFLRQGLRRRRGSIWVGKLRPFLLTASIAALLISLLPIPFGLQMRDDEALVFIVMFCFALVLGTFVWFLRGPVADRERPLADRLGGAMSRSHPERGANGWQTCGIVLWILGVGLGLVVAAARLGLVAESGPAHTVFGETRLQLLSRGGWWLSGLLLIAASMSIAAARSRVGVLHLARGVVGQGAVLLALVMLAGMVGSVEMIDGKFLHASLPQASLMRLVIGGLLSGALGSLLLAWPPARSAAPAAPDKSRAE